MAEAARLPDRLQESLHCPVCFHCYDDPRNLPCQHTFCRGCIHKLSAKSPLTCPLCNVRHHLSSTDSDELPKNYALANVIDTLCENCKQRQQLHVCPYCDKGLCLTCGSTHDYEHTAESKTILNQLQGQIAYLEHRNIKRKEESAKKVDRVKAEIQTAFSVCAAALHNRETELVELLHSLVHQEENSNTQTELRDKLECVKQFCDGAIKGIDANNDSLNADSDNMSSLREIKDQGKNFSKTLTGCDLAEVGRKRLFFPYSSQNVLQMIKSFGKVLVIQDDVDSASNFQLNRPVSVDYMPTVAPKYTIGKRVKNTSDEKEDLRRPWGISCSARDGSTVITDSENHKVYIFAEEELVVSFGERGRSNGQFYRPRGVTVNYEDNIYVADSHNNRIQVFDGKGRFWNTFGRKGSGPGMYNQPMGLTFDNSTGLLYVCDAHNYRVQVHQEDGTVVRSFGSRGQGSHQFNSIPCHVCVSHSGKVFVTDRTAQIHVFNQDGDVLELVDVGKVVSGPCNLAGICVDPSGNVIVASEQGQVVALWDDGRAVECIRQISSEETHPVCTTCIRDITFNNEGVMFVCDSNNQKIRAYETEMHF